MKSKYTDNKLAEEFDLVILVNDEHKKIGLPEGSLGTLIASYERTDKPLYVDFQDDGGAHFQAPVALADFRVLDVKNSVDLSLVTKYLRRLQKCSRGS